MRIGTRPSALARTQSEGIAAALRTAHAGLNVTIEPITTSGDRSQPTDAVTPDWGRGVFVKDLELALLEGKCDLAVHSAKDVPTAVADDLVLLATPERENPLDAVVTRDGRSFADLPGGSRIGTSSSRRSAFLGYARPDLTFVPVRGNVDTRCRKLLDRQYDAIVLAIAGLSRLRLDVPWQALSERLLPPAPGQGALALEARADDRATARLVNVLGDSGATTCVAAERRVMGRLEAGCRLPLGVLGTISADGSFRLLGGVAAPHGARVIWAEAAGPPASWSEIADDVSGQLIHAGAREILAGPPDVAVAVS